MSLLQRDYSILKDNILKAVKYIKLYYTESEGKRPKDERVESQPHNRDFPIGKVCQK